MDYSHLEQLYAEMTAEQFAQLNRDSLTPEAQPYYDREMKRRSTPEWRAQQTRLEAEFRARVELAAEIERRRREPPIEVELIPPPATGSVGFHVPYKLRSRRHTSKGRLRVLPNEIELSHLRWGDTYYLSYLFLGPIGGFILGPVFGALSAEWCSILRAEWALVSRVVVDPASSSIVVYARTGTIRNRDVIVAISCKEKLRDVLSRIPPGVSVEGVKPGG